MGRSINLEGKVALITGASSGLGKRFALVLSQAGAKVVLASRRVDRLKELRAEIEASGGAAHVVSLDVTDYQSIKADFDSVSSLYNLAVEKRDEAPDSARRQALQADVDARNKQVEELDAKLVGAQKELDATLKKLKAEQDAQTKAEEALSKAEVTRRRQPE